MEAVKIPEHLSFYQGTTDELFELHPTTDSLFQLLTGRPYQHCPWKGIEALIDFDLAWEHPQPEDSALDVAIIPTKPPACGFLIDIRTDIGEATQELASLIICKTPLELTITLARLRSGITRCHRH